MRLSATPSSQFYYGDVVTAFGGDPHSLRVMVDGVDTQLCVEADDSEGWADVLVEDDEGNLELTVLRDGPRIARRHGVITFAWESAT